MKDKWLIYKIVFPNGKHYIGLTKDLNKRIARHKSSANLKERKPVYNAINHFGWDNIEFHEIHTDIETLEEANELEKKYIQEYGSYIKNKKGYNATLGGDGCNGRPPSKKQLEVLVKRNKKMWKDPEYRRKIKESQKCIEYSQEYREKVSKRIKSHIAENGHNWTGKKHREESKKKMSGPRPDAKYSLASYYRGKRVYCSKLKVVFFSVQHCADFLGISKASAHYRVNHGKNTTLSEYKELK